MRPMLDDLELPQVQEIATYDRRMLAQHEIPGLKGSLLQNMGRKPGRILLWGVNSGDKALELVGKLDQKFRDGAPVTFVADITEDTKIDKVVIEDLRWEELAGKPNRFAYALTLNEFIEPTQPKTSSGVEMESPLGELGLPIDTSILEDAQGLMDNVTGALAGTEIVEKLAQQLNKLTELLKRLP